jgi:hypothetical protein
MMTMTVTEQAARPTMAMGPPGAAIIAIAGPYGVINTGCVPAARRRTQGRKCKEAEGEVIVAETAKPTV